MFSIESLFAAWKIFRRRKAKKSDVMDFEAHLEDNLFCLLDDLKKGAYQHSPYRRFQIFDNKKRCIHQAEVKDKIVHRIVDDYLSAVFEPIFIADSYASRIGKGQYKAIETFRYFIKLSGCDRSGCYVLKCDIKKYFDSVDHAILLGEIKRKVLDRGIFRMIEEIVFSYHSSSGEHKGIPLGNVTSQIFANIYLNMLDTYIKKELRCRWYVRYNDDFLIVANSKEYLEEIRNKIIVFSARHLLLEIPFWKISIRKIEWGVDFLGFTVLPKAVLLRDKTKSRIYANINRGNIRSYFGVLDHCNSFYLKQKLLSLDKLNEIC